MSLFPVPQRQTHLVEFNAGKCIRDESTLKPDLRKGVIYMDQSDDQLMHFYWKERKSSEPEDDFIIFPDEAELTRVSQCSTGRVYVLKFKSSGQTSFYWMQNKKEDKDDELVSRVNQLINDPQGHNSSDLDFESNSNAQADLMQILGNQGDISQDNVLQYFQNSANSGLTIVTPATWQQAGNKLAEITVNGGTDLELGDSATEEAINVILNDADISSALFPFVQEQSNHLSAEQVVQSIEFQNRLQVIHEAIQQDELKFLLDELKAEKNIESFLTQVRKQAECKKANDDEDDPMDEN
ncbi:adhesion regulating molecule [Backusella circina FSU 941]|nr:adhesion regulating molecule [Backusella circina FSU 941]